MLLFICYLFIRLFNYLFVNYLFVNYFHRRCFTAQKMKISMKEVFRQFPADLVTFTEKILNGKLHFFAVILNTSL